METAIGLGNQSNVDGVGDALNQDFERCMGVVKDFKMVGLLLKLLLEGKKKQHVEACRIAAYMLAGKYQNA